MEDDKLPAGVVLGMDEPLDSCFGCYFFTHPLESCPKEYADLSRRIISCINGRNVIFKQIGVSDETK